MERYEQYANLLFGIQVENTINCLSHRYKVYSHTPMMHQSNDFDL